MGELSPKTLIHATKSIMMKLLVLQTPHQEVDASGVNAQLYQVHASPEQMLKRFLQVCTTVDYRFFLSIIFLISIFVLYIVLMHKQKYGLIYLLFLSCQIIFTSVRLICEIEIQNSF